MGYKDRHKSLDDIHKDVAHCHFTSDFGQECVKFWVPFLILLGHLKLLYRNFTFIIYVAKKVIGVAICDNPP